MGSQVNFFAIAEDLATLLQAAEDAGLLAVPQMIEANEEGDVVEIMEDDWYGLGPNLPPKLPTQIDLDDSAFFYLFPSQFSPIDLLYRYQLVWSMETFQPIPGERRLILNDWLSPVIQVIPSNRVEDKVYDGRIFLGMERDHRWYREARKLYDRLARRIRKWPQTEPYRLYVGLHSARLQKAGHIRLILTAGEREVGVEA